MDDPLARHLAVCRARIDRYAPSEVPAALDAGAVLVDIRTEGQRRALGVVPGALWYPRNCLEWRCVPGTEALDPAIARAGGRVILLCMHGYQTSLVAAALRELGVGAAGDVAGGFERWAADGMPVRPFDEALDLLQGSDEAPIRNY